MTEHQGAFTVPTRLFLSPEHRVRLERLVREQESDLANVSRRSWPNTFDRLPPSTPQPEVPANNSAELRKRRAELARLRGQQEAAGAHAPGWLAAYITELEGEIRLLKDDIWKTGSIKQKRRIVMSTQPQGAGRIRRAILELVRTAIQVLVLFLIISALIGRFEIHQVCMEPNFHEGQRVIVSKLDNIWDNILVKTAHAAEPGSSPFTPKRGQVVVFYPPSGTGDALIKRVVGVPGDSIELRGDGAHDQRPAPR